MINSIPAIPPISMSIMKNPTSSHATGSSYAINDSEIINKLLEKDRTAQNASVEERTQKLHSYLTEQQQKANFAIDQITNTLESSKLLLEHKDKVVPYCICAALANLGVAGYSAFQVFNSYMNDSVSDSSVYVFISIWAATNAIGAGYIARHMREGKNPFIHLKKA